MIDKRKLAKSCVYLERYVRTVERSAEVNQEDMAKQGISFAVRQQRVKEADSHKDEAEHLRWALQRLRELDIE